MTASDEAARTTRTKSGDAAWLEAKREIADRNDEARKVGMAERSEREQRQSAARRKSERNGIYR